MREGRFIEKLGNGSGFFQKWLEVDRFCWKMGRSVSFLSKNGYDGLFS